MAFKPAERKAAKLRIAIDGKSGDGKSYTALLVAFMLGIKVAFADSERSSGLKYCAKPGQASGPGHWRFDHDDITDKTPMGYVQKMSEAAEGGYDVLIIDSASHAWKGALEQIDQGGGWTKAGKNVTPRWERLIDAILSYPGHVIATFRSKAKHEIEKDEKTQRTTMRKVAVEPVTREGTEFEFDFWLSLDGEEKTIKVVKSRWGDGVPVGETFSRDDLPLLVNKIKGWLDDGAPVSVLDSLSERMRFAKNEAALKAMLPDLEAASKADPAIAEPLRTAYIACKKTLIAAAAAATASGDEGDY